ncbi:MAG: DUF3137 domain-containing protein [Alphaproteobacteria bacterium]|nr:DUF3137 domain-containing protein [Alphaproteobacteria bacterium]
MAKVKGYKDHSQQSFKKYYDKKLAPLYAELLPNRKKLIEYILLLSVLLMLDGIVLSLLFYDIIEMQLSSKIYPFFIFAIPQIICFVVYSFILGETKQYKRKVKSLLIPKFINFFGKFKYGNYPISREIIEKSSLFVMPEFRNYIFDDCFKGKYKSTVLHIAEERLIFRTSLCVLVNFNKKFEGQTVVYSSKHDGGFYLLLLMVLLVCCSLVIMYFNIETVPMFLLSWSAGIYFYCVDRKTPQKSSKAKTESIDFSKRWKIETTNQVEARYILTPAFMEQMIQTCKSFRSNNLNFSFFENKLLIIIRSQKNWFELAPFFSSNYQKAEECFEQLNSILSVIDILLPDNEE